VRNKYQRKQRKSNRKLEVVGGEELMVRVPVPMAEVWEEMQAQVEELTGKAGLQILRILENEVTRRVGPPHRPNPSAGCVRWGKQSGYVVFGGQKIPLERPRVRTREGHAMNHYTEERGVEKIFRQLERINPSAARSLEEGLEKTLTVHRLGVGAVLRRKLATTNPSNRACRRYNG
jgi:hypothetical protein